METAGGAAFEDEIRPTECWKVFLSVEEGLQFPVNNNVFLLAGLWFPTNSWGLGETLCSMAAHATTKRWKVFVFIEGGLQFPTNNDVLLFAGLQFPTNG